MKDKLIIKFTRGMMLLIIAFLFSGCIQRTLDQLVPDMPVNISFDWKNLVNGGKQPSGMVLSIYNSDGTLYTTETCSANGFMGTLPQGTYKVLAYNEDAQGVEGKYMDNYDKAQIVASATKAVAITQSSNVYGIGLANLTISNNGINEQKMIPNSLAKQVTLNIGVTGEKSAISNCQTTLSGISRAVNLSTGALIPEEATLSFEPTSSSNGYQSTVSFFGVIPTVTNEMATVVTFTNGGTQTLPVVDLTKDLTAALSGNSGATAPVDVKVEIAVTGTVIGGFSATLVGWTVVKRNLNVE